MNIMRGKDVGNGKKMRRYKDISDILDIKGITPEIFTKVCNLITTKSDQFRIQVLAETLNDVNKDGKINTEDGDEILAKSRIDRIIDRSQLTDDNPDTHSFLFLR